MLLQFAAPRLEEEGKVKEEARRSPAAKRAAPLCVESPPPRPMVSPMCTWYVYVCHMMRACDAVTGGHMYTHSCTYMYIHMCIYMYVCLFTVAGVGVGKLAGEVGP